MAEAATHSRPIPSGWSDSSDDGNNNRDDAAAGRGGGGFDDSSSDGGWSGGRGGGGGMREFERSSAENTREALLDNDALLLCEPPASANAGSADNDGRQTSPLSPPPPPPVPLRYVPGDPFANEEADVGAWAKHFTYLSVVPTERGEGGDAEKRSNDNAGGGLLERGPVAEPPPVRDVMETDEETGGVAAVEGSRIQDLTPEEAAAELAGRRLEEMPQGEEVFASHGVYEEYLAYDCRPPGFDDVTSPGGETMGPGEEDPRLAAKGSGAWAVTGVVPNANSAVGQGAWVSNNAASEPPALGASTTGGSHRVVARLDTPQRELRQEIMDRLFDELWERITPDLLLVLRQQQAAAGGRGGGEGGGEGLRTATRKDMED